MRKRCYHIYYGTCHFQTSKSKWVYEFNLGRAYKFAYLHLPKHYTFVVVSLWNTGSDDL